ncbi:MAG: class I SAM-dependent methyltransferase [Myxococcaceae bacterium]|nr:class I SAM-dependent methyltransferase [Myxococcaceae bacterium]
MGTPGPRFWQVFFEVYEHLPRQGPGNRACAKRALELCADLPTEPRVLDLGCGVGGQTLHLAELLPGAHLTALDSHAPSIERLRTTVAARGLEGRVRPLVGDMARSGLPAGHFDLLWSEGALYNLGLENALGVCHGLLRPGGTVAFTDAVWRKEGAPPEVRAGFEADYPTMGRVADVLAALARTGFSLNGHFTLPDEAWWDDFYTPMERRIAELEVTHAGDPDALATLEQLAQEPELYRRYSDFFAYEFFVAHR